MSSTNSSFGLNIHLLSFDLPSNLVKYSDDIRVSITTIPEENKQAFTISARKMKDSHIVFGVNVNIPQENIPNDFVTAGTEKIIFVFRKKSFLNNDPIIASTTIKAKELPKNLSEPASIKVFNIYEPKHNCPSKSRVNKSKSCIDEEKKEEGNRRIIGRMQAQLSLTDPFHLKDFDDGLMADLDNNESVQDQFKYSNRHNNYFGFKALRH